MRKFLIAVLLTSVAASAAPFGSDGFYSGTYYPGGANNPVYSFVSHTAAATNVAIVDDDAATVPLGSAFSFYGTNFASATMSSNGNLQFGASAQPTRESNGPIPNSFFGGAIFAFWDDLIIRSDFSFTGSAKYEYFASSPTAALTGPVSVFSWLNPLFFDAQNITLGSFQILLSHSSGRIIVQYEGPMSTSSASIGIQENSSRGLAYSVLAGNTLSERSAIVYDPISTSDVPEPSSFLLASGALAAISLLRRKR